MPMYWETSPPTGNWRLTKDLWVWYNSAWTPVRSAWIWSGAQWELCHVASATLNSFSVFDTSGFCDPTVGSFRATWTYSTAFPGEWGISIDYSFDSGSTWDTFASGIDVTLGSYDGSLDGVFGFTSLSNTYFRLQMVQGTTQATDSPRLAYPPYVCI